MDLNTVIERAEITTDKSKGFRYGDFTSMESAEGWRDLVADMLFHLKAMQRIENELSGARTALEIIADGNSTHPERFARWWLDGSELERVSAPPGDQT